MRQILLFLLAVVMLLLAITSCACGSNRSSKVIQGQRVQLVDQNGSVRAEMKMNQVGDPTVVILDQTHSVRAEMRMQRGDPTVILYDEKGQNRITATEYFLRVRDPKAGSITLEFDHDGPFITLGFEDGSDPKRIDLVELANMLAKDGNSN